MSISAKTELTYNDPGLVKMMLPSIEKAAGTGNVAAWNWITGSEDFSYYSLHAPAFFFFLGGMQPGADPAKIRITIPLIFILMTANSKWA